MLNCEAFELNGLKTFVKVKTDSLAIGKVKLSFVEFNKQTNKLTSSVDIYIPTGDMLLFCFDVLSGRLPKLATEAAKGKQFPPPVFSKQGGVGPEAAKAKYGRKDGKALARVFNFGASSKEGCFLIQGLSGPGKQDERGLIQMENITKPEVRINVPCSVDDLKKMCLTIQLHIQAFEAAQYATGAYLKDISATA